MKRTLVPAILAVAVGLSGAAWAAASTTTGVIKTLDMSKHMFTLSDGTEYMVPKSFKDPGLKVGDKVNVTWTMKGKNHEATAVVIEK